MQEEWRDIEGFDGDYQVSNLGRVRSCKHTKGADWIIMKPLKNMGGYLTVGLCKDGKHKCCRVHRLVASAFLPNSKNLPQINHKDEVKTNNRVDNLEWCDASYNANYGTRNERAGKAQSKPISQYTLNGEFVRQYKNLSEAEQYGFNQGNINSCCNNKYNKRKNIYKGFIWKLATAPPPPKTTHEQLSLKIKPIIQYTLNGEFVRQYKNLSEAKKYGFEQSAINRCCNNKYSKTKNIYKNYIFQFASAPPPPKTTYEQIVLF